MAIKYPAPQMGIFAKVAYCERVLEHIQAVNKGMRSQIEALPDGEPDSGTAHFKEAALRMITQYEKAFQ
jgi:hypothetical protein